MISKILGQFKRGGKITWDMYEEIHSYYPSYATIGVILPFPAILFAYFGWGGLNQALMVIAILFSGYFGSSRAVVSTAVVAGALTNLKDPGDGSKGAMVNVFKGITIYFFYLSFWYLVLGTVEIDRNWGNLFTIVVTIFMIILMTVEWALATPWPKRLMITFVVLLLITKIVSVVPAVYYNKTIGFDLAAEFRTTPVDKQIVAAEETARSIRDSYVSQMLAGISNQIDPGTGKPVNIDLLTAEIVRVEIRAQKIEAIKKKQYQHVLTSLKEKVQYSFRNPNGVEGAEDNPEITIIKHSDKVWEIIFNTDQMTTVLRRWPAGTTIVFAGFNDGEVFWNDPAGGDTPFNLSVGVPLRRTVDKPFIAKNKIGGKILLNFS